MKKKVLIVTASYYWNITASLRAEAEFLLDEAKIKFDVIDVPGVFEIPVTIAKNIKKYDGFIALGCVIKGETPHFDLICKSTFESIQYLSITYNKPIGNGIITSLNKKQAYERCGKLKYNKPNKGSEAARAVLSILKNG